MNRRTLHKLAGVVILLMMPLLMCAQATTVTTTAKSGDETVTVTYQYAITGANCKEIERYKDGTEDQYTQVIKYKGEAREGTEVTVSIKIVSVNGDPDIGSYKAWIQGPSSVDWPEVVKSKGDGFPEAKMRYTVSASDKSGNSMIYLVLHGTYEGDDPRLAGPNLSDLSVTFLLEVTNGLEETSTPSTQPDEDINPFGDDNEVVIDEPKPVHIVEDDNAWGFEGVWPFTIPASVLIGLLGYTLTKGKKEEGDGEDPKNPDPREMHIYKAFGNSLLAGDAPKQVFAKIVRKPRGGGEVTDVALTQMIQITPGDQYMQVRDAGMHGEWRTAWIAAPETDNVPDEGIVNFHMGNEGGSYTNRLHFKIEAGEVLFGQDNLTLPAHYKKEVRLPFVVLGMDGCKGVKASILDGDRVSSDYGVKVEWNEKEQMYYAVIHDQKTDPEKDNGVPGKYLTYSLLIEAQNPGGKLIKGDLPIYRYYMGLAIHVGDIGCYVEEYNDMKHRTRKFAAIGEGGRTYVPAETQASIILYEYDEENHKILQLAPILTDYKLTAFSDEKQQLVDKLALQCELTTEAGSKGGRMVIFRCCRATLDAPSRIEVKMELTANHAGREYKGETKVRLCSQPVRHFDSMEEDMAALKEDKRIGDRLIHIQTAIYEQGLYHKLFPLEKFIGVMLDGYDAAYGYDPKQVKMVRDLYTGVLTGRIEGANGEGAKPMTFADEAKLFLEVFMSNSKKVEESLGFFGRMAVGVCTLGCSEVVFTGLEVVNNMKEYVDKGGDSVWGGFCVGAKVVVREYITEKLMNKGFEKLGKAAKEAGITPDALKKASQEMLEEGKGFLTTMKGKFMKNAISETSDATRKAVAKGEVLSKMVKSKPLTKAEKELLEISEFGLEHAKEQVRDLQAAIDLYRMNPYGPGNQEMMRKLILDVQQNKQAMYLLKNADDSMNYVRSKFNTTLEEIYVATDASVKKRLSQATGIPEHMIQKVNATTSDKALLIQGKKVTMDRDVTYYWKDQNGVEHYFSQKNTNELYNKAFYENSLGYKAKDSKFSDRFASKMDQTNIEDVLNHKESYGLDLDNMLDPKLHKEALINPTKVSETVTYKGKEWFSKGEAMLEQAKNITDLTERQLMQSNGVSSIMEGLRQEVKQFDNFVNLRDLARKDINMGSRIPQNLRDAVERCRRITDMESADALVIIERELAEFGYTRNSFAEAMGEAIKAIG